jgi:hypothetical protein
VAQGWATGESKRIQPVDDPAMAGQVGGGQSDPWIPSSGLKNTVAMRLGKRDPAVILGLSFVSAQLQGFTNLRLRQSLAQTQKSSLRIGYSIF